MSWEFKLLQEPYGGTSEGPVWDGSGVLFTQIDACRILRYCPETGSFSVYRSDTNYANGLMMDSKRRLHACEGGTRRVVCYEPDQPTKVLADSFEGHRLNIPNDLVIDRQGRIWFTDPFYEGAAGPFSYDRVNQDLNHESVYRLDPSPDGSWTIQRMTFDTTRPNGLLFSEDEKTLYVAQSGRRGDEKRELRAYPVDDMTEPNSYHLLHDFGDNRGVDGMCLDVDGNIIATAGWDNGGPGPSIYVFAPNGEAIERHPVPAKRPTNCTFGGEDLSMLYVTSTEGHFFCTRTDRRGLALL